MTGLGRVAVVGAGMAGLACARGLADAGVAVTVFDKGRALGGRIASRRTAEGPVDHGAVALQVGPSGDATGFAACLRHAADAGAAAEWPAAQGWVGLPGMSGIVQPLARGLTVKLSAEVAGLAPVPGGWQVQAAAEATGTTFDQVILAVPQPQAQVLLKGAPGLAARLAPARMRPVWTAMARFDGALPLSGDLIRSDRGAVMLAVRNSAKPGRGGAGDCLVLHAAEAWTVAHLEHEKPDAAARLLAAFFAQAGLAPRAPSWVEGHRWRYGLTVQALGLPFVRDTAARLSVCGDWCLGDSAADAFASGQALAADLLRQ